MHVACIGICVCFPRVCDGDGLVTKSCPWTLVTLWTVAYQASLPMEFSRQEYGSVLPFPSSRDLSDPGIEPGSPALQLSHKGAQKSVILVYLFSNLFFLTTLHGLWDLSSLIRGHGSESAES